MSAVVLLLIVAFVSLLITRVATVALTTTGMARPVARFQARSALSGVGFTTSEAEAVVNHPVRRRIIMGLMLIGNLGLATAMAGLLGGFLRADAGASLMRAMLLVIGLASLYFFSKSEVVDRRLSRIIGRVLSRHTDLDLRDHDRLLHLSGEYSVKEIAVMPNTWLSNHTLGELRLKDEGVLVLGVTRADGSYLPVPGKETALRGGDSLIVYGSDSAVLGLSSRPVGYQGEAEHERQMKVNDEVELAQELFDPARGAG